MNDRPGTRDSVQCHSGYTYAQRPVSFTHNGKDYQVERVITEKRLPEVKSFLVAVESGEVFELLFNELSKTWTVHPSAKTGKF